MLIVKVANIYLSSMQRLTSTIQPRWFAWSNWIAILLPRSLHGMSPSGATSGVRWAKKVTMHGSTITWKSLKIRSGEFLIFPSNFCIFRGRIALFLCKVKNLQKKSSKIPKKQSMAVDRLGYYGEALKKFQFLLSKYVEGRRNYCCVCCSRKWPFFMFVYLSF